MFRLKLHEDPRVRTLTDEQIRETFKHANPYQRLFLALAVYTGMRRGEIQSLRWNQVDFKAKIISLEATQTKTKRQRIIPIPEPLLHLLEAERSENPNMEHVVVYRGRGVGSIVHSWESLRRQVPFLKAMHFHDWRHVYATKLRSLEVDLHVIQTILGHTDQRMTQRYANYDGKSLHPYVLKLQDYMHEGDTKAGKTPRKARKP
jgi:integrase